MRMLRRFEELQKKRINCSVKSYLWSLSGIVGNILFSRPVPKKTENSKNFLNLGCGSRHLN